MKATSLLLNNAKCIHQHTQALIFTAVVVSHMQLMFVVTTLVMRQLRRERRSHPCACRLLPFSKLPRPNFTTTNFRKISRQWPTQMRSFARLWM
jgi:hypothetical protein